MMQNEKKRFRKPIFAGASVIVCLAVLAAILLTSATANVFTVTAYALEDTEGGVYGYALGETDLLEQLDVIGGRFDGENFFLNIGLKYEGENLKSVRFSTKNGFFALQYLSDYPDRQDDIPAAYIGPENRLVMLGNKFDLVGSEIVFDENTNVAELLIFWGMTGESVDDPLPEKIEIAATALFRDGRTQTVPVTIDLSGTVMILSYQASEEELREAEQQLEYYKTLPLEQCELIEDSVKTVTDYYEYYTGNGERFYYMIYDEMEFDDDGAFRFTFSPLIGVIRRSADGAFTGMVYRVPEELIYPQDR